MKLFEKLTNWYFSQKALPYWAILFVDIILLILSGVLSLGLMRHFNSVSDVTLAHIILSIMIFVAPYLIGFRAMHTYSGVLRYSSFVDLQRLVSAMLIGSVLSYGFSCIISELSDKVADTYAIILTWREYIGSFVIGVVLMWGIRVGVKLIFDRIRVEAGCKRAFIYGTYSGGVGLAKSIMTEERRKYKLLGFVSADNRIQNFYLMGVKVYSNDDFIDHMKELRADVLIISPLQVERFRNQQELVNRIIDEGIKIMMLPPLVELSETQEEENLETNQLKEVEIEDLLPRDEISVDLKPIEAFLREKKILITGAAGSIGSEITRQVAKFNPSVLILVDQAETPMHDIRLMMSKEYPHIKSETIVTSICNKERMESIFRLHRPDYVFHAAAYKHVPMMEDNPSEAVQNNIYGTRIIADLAVKYATKKFVMISTDKAVNPTNVMGCSKRICEIYCQSLSAKLRNEATSANQQTTQFVTTRFGNVLGSNGSVIPLFREQIKKGGPVTVTHPDIVRYFMLIPEACKLVLEAGTMGQGGEIFIFDMGKPVRIADLAKRMITLSGAKDVRIKYTGLRDGEKLYEEVLNDEETTKPTFHKKIKIATVREYDYNEIKRLEEELYELSMTYDDMAIVRKMKEIVPEYKSNNSKYEILDHENVK